MISFLKKKYEQRALPDELEQINTQLYCADSEFNNVCDELHIRAAVFRLCELETRRSIILKKMRRESE